MIYILLQSSPYVFIAQQVKHHLTKMRICSQIISVPHDLKALHIIVALHEYFDKIPPNSIALQFEEINESTTCLFHPKFKDEYIIKLRQCSFIFDFSPHRIPLLNNMGLSSHLMCFGYDQQSEYLQNRVRKGDRHKIFFYGFINKRREQILAPLADITSTNDKMVESHLLRSIKGSEIVINVNLYNDSVLDVPYIMLLLHAGAFVISEKGIDTNISSIFQNCVYFCDTADFRDVCEYWLDPVNIIEKQEWIAKAMEYFHLMQFNLPLDMVYTLTGDDMLNGNDNSPPDEEIESQYLPFNNASMNIHKNGSSSLTLSKDLGDSVFPTVTVVTPTRNRSILFEMAIRNWKSFKYPREKLDWIIIDDTPVSPDYDIKSKLPISSNINYIWMPSDTPITISDKRNMGLDLAKGDIIVHMDDDDYYYPMSIYAKVKLLQDNIGYECVGTNKLGLYNISDNYSHTSIGTTLPEGSMAYWNTFGQKGRFGQHTGGESIPFLRNRRHQVLVFPFQFNMVAMTHKSNTTGSLRESHKKEGNDIYKSLDFETQRFINKLYRRLRQHDPNPI